MDEFIKELDKNLDYESHEIKADEIIIHVKSNRTEIACPYCGGISQEVHSHYKRSFKDLPLMGKKTTIVINNRKMFCKDPRCSHKTFAEYYDCLEPKGKKSKRLLDQIIKVSLAVSSVAASNILKDGIADVGKSTICNLLKKRYTNP